MRKKSMRLVSAALAMCMILSILPVNAFALVETKGSVSAQAAVPGQTEAIKINEKNFPDENFRKFIQTGEDYDTKVKFDQNGDDWLSPEEIAAVTSIACSYTGIHDLTGIKYFTSLKTLRCGTNNLKTLDLSGCTALTELYCGAVGLTTVDVSGCTALETLDCDNSSTLTVLNVEGCTSLKSLRCKNNGLTALDVSSCTALSNLDCRQNYLTTLNVSKNQALTVLECSNNLLETLDVSANSKLHGLDCKENTLETLDVSGNIELWWLDCSGNRLTSLDVSKIKIADMGRFQAENNGYEIKIRPNRTFDLTTLPGKFDVSKASKWNGGTVVGNTLTVDDDDTDMVTYLYDCGTTQTDYKCTATFTLKVVGTAEDDPIPEPDPVGPSDTDNIQGAISAVVIGAAAGAIIYEAGTGIYRVINMPGIPMPSDRIELAELLWEHAGKPEPVSTALYSDIDEGDTDAQKAAHWAVEQDLMKDNSEKNTFNPHFPVSKLRTCLTWNAAKEKGLFAKTEE